MAEAMVTARMSTAKKEAANAILSQLGINASQAINQLYDYVLEKKALPFDTNPTKHTYSSEDWAQAAAFIDSITTLPAHNVYSTMTDKDIKLQRLAHRGLLES